MMGYTMSQIFGRDTSSDVERLPQLLTNSWEILDNITWNHKFACLIRSVTVYTLCTGPAIYESLCLAKALRALPCLHTFRWFGRKPDLPVIVAESLPAKLSSLVLYAQPETTASFTHLRHLRDILLNDLAVMANPPLLTVFRQNTKTLKRISFYFDLSEQMPIHLFDNLTHFHLLYDIRTENPTISLDLALRHATALECLSLEPSSTSAQIHLIKSLPNSLDALPNLTSLRYFLISGTERLSTSLQVRLTHFIRHRRKLRRLFVQSEDLNIPSFSRPLFQTFRELTDLQVLGLSQSGVEIAEANEENEPRVYLIDCLPLNMTALHLDLAIDEETTDTLDLTSFTRGLSDFKRLTYFHLVDDFDSLPFDPSEFAINNPDMQLIGCGNQLWDVQSDRTNGLSDTIRWPIWKSLFAIEEDFRDEDHWWLYHASVDMSGRLQ
ncbi:hypothetical protein AX17_004462 [Amanita inopinata Kibby_2008]|nr:hypothetical protein AX17_004462 [Amanita inopinata Kibby_2008]